MLSPLSFTTSGFYKWLVSFLVGTLWSVLISPIVPMVCVCIFAMVADTITAWRLNRRCHRKYPQHSDGKLSSSKVFDIFGDFVVLFTALLLAHMIDEVVLRDFDTLFLPNWIAAVYCAYQLISIIENESSCNDKSWARLAQRVVANKISRHLDIDEHELEILLRKERHQRVRRSRRRHPSGGSDCSGPSDPSDPQRPSDTDDSADFGDPSGAADAFDLSDSSDSFDA